MKSYKLWSLVLAMTCLAACDKKLDLEPAQSISETLALDNDENVKSVLLGAYDALALDGLFGGNTIRDAELIAADGEIRWVGTYEGAARCIQSPDDCRKWRSRKYVGRCLQHH
ncbi:MAG: hypothetical protein IPL27_08870 [Lewinellaceae bacterium]|nr:hypothetical protein [Lewinellaceae bacterium]